MLKWRSKSQASLQYSLLNQSNFADACTKKLNCIDCVDYVNGYYWSYLRGSASAGAGANGTSYSNVGDVTMSAVARRRHQRRLNHELFQAIYVRNLERVKDLIEKGADVNARSGLIIFVPVN